MPTDNVAESDLPDDIDLSLRLKYLETLNEKLEKLLRSKFHVFWSQVIFDQSVSRFVDSYLRFCLRAHDLEGLEDSGASAEEQAVTKEVSRRMLQLLVRLSRPQESPSDYLSQDKFAQVILESQVFDVPKIIDICVIYGDANRSTVTKIVHSAFRCQPLFKEDFRSVVQHMLDGLLQCCAPLQFAARGQALSDQDLSVNECLSFLPDMLSCFNAIFCFFPEDCVDKLMGGSLKVDGASGSTTAVPLADLMVLLHDAVSALRSKSSDGKTQLDSIIKLLSRLLTCVLGFRMAPRHGANAFGDLVSWLVEHSERTELIQDLSRNGLDNIAMEWIASGLVDDTQLDYLDDVCGAPLLPKEARHRRRPMPKAAASGAQAASSSSARPESSASTDRAKIREVREVVGNDYGEGFILQCLLHYGGSVPQVVGAILDGSLPPQLSALPTTLAIGAEPTAAAPSAEVGLSAEDKKRVLGQACDGLCAWPSLRLGSEGCSRLQQGLGGAWKEKKAREEQTKGVLVRGRKRKRERES
ncbi:ASCC2 [Symbiodinium natans]|uniref:ASCC2 protein n=1 Tax=Symbiodinium natans TaxID=878477 RepID=A0A812TDS9_9DINO|nr:ASCC2 [Symbiodinium natans]